ncbi:MAG: hypothetical protein NVSMB9_29300 [Isosphaeraceae bacterium]
MKTCSRFIVLGTMASNPYAGMAWMHMQLVAGLRRLGHDAYYFEVTSSWPYDPVRETHVSDSDYAVPYLTKVADDFGLSGKWAFRRSFSDNAWFGMEKTRAESLLADADAVFNVTASTNPGKEGLKVGRLVYYGTDPVGHEIAFSQGDEGVRSLIAEHRDLVTYGENIGNPDCPIPPLPGLKARTRQPILLDIWECGPPTRPEFTTVANWKQDGDDLVFNGETYFWSKHHEFLKFLDVPRFAGTPVELATTPDDDVTTLLRSHGWGTANAHEFTTDPWRYRHYVQSSRAEFTVAKDQNVRLRSGWFSERSACYLAAGRPVITQDTGFGCALPTGEGLFAFNTRDDALAAFEAINSDYPRHSRAARAIAEEYFRAETVLAKLLDDLG